MAADPALSSYREMARRHHRPPAAGAPCTVTRVLAQAGLPRTDPPLRRSRVEPYLPFILETLQKFPPLTASRLYVTVRERGQKEGPLLYRQMRPPSSL